MQNPANLDIWRRSIELAVRVADLGSQISGRIAPGLANQMRRASTSIPANIAEGAGQESPAQCVRFLSISIGSAFELESHLILLARLHPELSEFEEILDELRQIRRMTHSYREFKKRQVDERSTKRKPES